MGTWGSHEIDPASRPPLTYTGHGINVIEAEVAYTIN